MLQKLADRFHLVNDKNQASLLVFLDVLFQRTSQAATESRSGLSTQIEHMFQNLLEKNKKNKKKLQLMHLSKLKRKFIRKFDERFTRGDLDRFKMLISKKKFMYNRKFRAIQIRVQLSEKKYLAMAAKDESKVAVWRGLILGRFGCEIQFFSRRVLQRTRASGASATLRETLGALEQVF